MTPKAAFAFAFTLSLLAQTHVVGGPPGQPAESPESVARKALDAMKQERMEGFVGLMYPEALHSFREVLMSVVEAAARDGHEAYILGYVSLLLDGDRLIVSTNGYMYCLDPLTGRILWHNPLTGYGMGAPTSLVSVRGQSSANSIQQAAHHGDGQSTI